MEHLLKLAKVLRAAQVVAHGAHNNCKGATFFQDHDFFGKLYPVYESEYDSVVERYIGLTGETVEAVSIMSDAMGLISDMSCDSTEACLEGLDLLEKTLCKVCTDVCGQGSVSEGTRQLVGEICNQSEIRQYKIRQRIS